MTVLYGILIIILAAIGIVVVIPALVNRIFGEEHLYLDLTFIDDTEYKEEDVGEDTKVSE